MNKLIKTKAEHNAAMERLSALMDADPALGSPESDELELLAHLIETYEAKAHPISLPDPIDAIRFRMEQAGLTRKDLAPIIGSLPKVSEVLNRKRPLSIAMMRRLQTELGIPAEVLLQEPAAELPDAFPIDKFKPAVIKHMCAEGWFGTVTTVREIKDQLEEKMVAFFGPSFDINTIPAHYRKSTHSSYESDAFALFAWKTRVQQKADALADLPEFSPELINEDFLKLLTGLSTRTDGPLEAIKALNERGIGFVYESHLPGTHLDGAALHNQKGNPIIALTARHDRIDNFWFCLLHELGHVKLHLESKGEILDDDLDQTPTSKTEKEADHFALEASVPAKRWKAVRLACKTPLSLHKVARTEVLHPAIIAGRIRKETGNYKRFSKLIGHGQVRKQLATH